MGGGTNCSTAARATTVESRARPSSWAALRRPGRAPMRAASGRSDGEEQEVQEEAGEQGARAVQHRPEPCVPDVGASPGGLPATPNGIFDADAQEPRRLRSRRHVRVACQAQTGSSDEAGQKSNPTKVDTNCTWQQAIGVSSTKRRVRNGLRADSNMSVLGTLNKFSRRRARRVTATEKD